MSNIDDKHHRPIINNINLCKYCERDQELRFGVCLDCTDLELMFFDRKDILDNDYNDWTKGEILAYIIRRAMSYKNGINNE